MDGYETNQESQTRQTLRPGSRHCVVAAVLAFATFAVGCRTFEQDWQSAQTYANQLDDLSGCWEGTWENESGRKGGKIRAVITRQGPNSYRAQFKAKYLKFLPVHFEVPLEVADNGGVYSSQGEANLGWLAGGTRQFETQSTPYELVTSYGGKKGQGTFHLKRQTECTQCSANDQYGNLIEFAQFVQWSDRSAPAETPTEVEESKSIWTRYLPDPRKLLD